MKDIKVQVEKDHLEKLTKASGQSAIMELIWNSLDADAKNIKIFYKETPLGIAEIKVDDDGHGIKFDDAEKVFGSLGGSLKKTKRLSPEKRKLHGEEGQGRYKAFALGSLIKFESIFQDNGNAKYFDVQMDLNHLQHSIINDLKTAKKVDEKTTGVFITINNINQEKASVLASEKFKKSIEEKLAVYYLTYPNFNVWVNNSKLNFEGCIKNKYEEPFKVETDAGKKIDFKAKVLEWNIDNEKKIFYCGKEGVSYHEAPLGIKTTLPISIYIQSDYIENLHRQNAFMGEMDVVLMAATEAAKDIARKYLRQRLQSYAKDYISDLKRDKLYPYTTPAESEVEVAKRQVFDIVALQINDYVPKFGSQDNANKKLTLALVKEALESDTENFEKIFTEVINLPKDKREELKDILEKTSLVTVIDTMKEVTERLRMIYELRLLLFDEDISKVVKERKHLHKIVKNETWLLGDDYTYGADDITLKNVLKEYLQHIGREDFQEIKESQSNEELQDIPDICLWKQYSLGESGRFKNLIIELKRPSKTIGTTELEQIKKYARAVAKDDRFPKDKTKWIFVLLSTKLNDDAMSECNQVDRDFGHIDTKENYDVYVKRWGDLLNEAEARHQYLKTKLNYTVTENEEGIKLLKQKYSEYLPDEI